MRIGITGYPTYGGSGVVATELGQELAARGHVDVLWHIPQGFAPERKLLREEAVRVILRP